MFPTLNRVIIGSVLTALLAGCGSKSTGVDANILNPRTPVEVQARAEAVMKNTTDVTVRTFQNSAASQQVRDQMMGMRLSIIGDTSVSNARLTVTVTSVEKIDNKCKTGIYQGSMASDAFINISTWNSISGLGRFQCLDSNCTYLLMLIEQSRYVVSRNERANGAGGYVMSSVPVVFEHQSDGTYNPTDSSETGQPLASLFLITGSQEKGSLTCNAAVTANPVNPSPAVTNGTPATNTGVTNNTWF